MGKNSGRNGGIGSTGNFSHKFMRLDSALYKAAMNLGPTPRLPPKTGPGRGNNQKTLLTDEQVLEIRRLHEFEGWSPARLMEVYGHLGITPAYLSKLLTYLTRSKLIPKK